MPVRLGPSDILAVLVLSRFLCGKLPAVYWCWTDIPATFERGTARSCESMIPPVYPFSSAAEILIPRSSAESVSSAFRFQGFTLLRIQG